MVRITVNYAKCASETYKICVELCPMSVFRAGKSAKPEVVDGEKCILCRTCLVNCPGQAIEILP